MTNSLSTQRTNVVPSSYLNSLDPSERKIIDDANGISLARLKQTDRHKELKKMILLLNVVTGLPVPNNELMIILIDQLDKLIAEKFAMLTSLEIESCFRSHIPEESFGKPINLGLINGILSAYVGKRSEVLRNANLASKNSLKIDPMTDQQMINQARGEIQFYYNQRLKGNNRPHTFPFWAEVLVMDGFIRHEKEMQSFFTFCLETKVKNIYIYEPPTGTTNQKIEDLPF